jgi:ubiquitin carboxyl-terminal hydrolase 8
MDISKYHGKGYSGIINLGNTCFLNSCLQVLNHTYELNHVLETIHNNEKHTFINEWVKLQESLYKNTIVSPIEFVRNIHQLALSKNRELFTGWAQNDMSEFLLFMIECIHDNISRGNSIKINGKPKNLMDKKALICYTMLQKDYKKDYSEIKDLFYATYISEISSIDKKIIYNMKPELFFILDLPLPSSQISSINIYDCLDEFTKPEFMTGNNLWFNEKENIYQEIFKTIIFWNFPKILVITIKRFSPCGNHKRNDLVIFPIKNLDLSKYVTGYNSQKYVYDLFGICNHYGGTQGGHYNAFVLNSQKEWLLFDDTRCQKVESVITPMAYCLFYRMVSNLAI